MKIILTAFTLFIMVIAIHLYYIFRPIDGVDVHEMVVSFQSPIEQYNYHRSLKSVVDEMDLEAFQYLIHAHCGGGAGCYDHGRTLVQVLIKVGDRSFSGTIPALSEEDKGLLLNLLSAGHEYGSFSVFPEWEDLKGHFPLTFGVLTIDSQYYLHL